LDVNPALVLSLWTGGTAACGAVVAWWRIVGPGYSWLTGAVVAVLGVGAGAAGSGRLAYVGAVLAIAGALMGRRPPLAAAFFAGSAVALGLAAGADSPWVPVLSGMAFLGGVTATMMLGHWYLVDPRLPRSALERLDVVAGAGLLIDFIYLVLNGALDWVPADAIFGWAFVALTLMTFLLLVAVWYSLQEPSYTGVMAATGLSYLAVLTSFGVVVLGRLLAFGSS